MKNAELHSPEEWCSTRRGRDYRKNNKVPMRALTVSVWNSPVNPASRFTGVFGEQVDACTHSRLPPAITACANGRYTAYPAARTEGHTLIMDQWRFPLLFGDRPQSLSDQPECRTPALLSEE